MEPNLFNINNQIFSKNNILLEIVNNLQQIINNSNDNVMIQSLSNIIIKMNIVINDNKKNLNW